MGRYCDVDKGLPTLSYPEHALGSTAGFVMHLLFRQWLNNFPRLEIVIDQGS